MTPDFCLQRNPPICTGDAPPLSPATPPTEAPEAPLPVTVSVVTPIPAELTTTTSEAVAPQLAGTLPATGIDAAALITFGLVLIVIGVTGTKLGNWLFRRSEQEDLKRGRR